MYNHESAEQVMLVNGEVKTVDVRGVPVFVSIRNPWDVAASRFRFRGIRTAEDNNLQSEAGLHAELEEMKKGFNGLEKLRGYEKTVIFRYHEFFGNLMVIIDGLEKFMGCSFNPEAKKQWLEEFSFENNLRRSNSGDKDVLRHYQIYPGHVGVGVPWTWRGIIPPWGYKMMDEYCKPIAERWGYVDQTGEFGG